MSHAAPPHDDPDRSDAVAIGRRAVLGGLAALSSAAVARASSPRTIDVRRFGASGDGRTDDTAAIRAGQAAAAAANATLIFPRGSYVLRGWTDTSDTPVRWRSDDGARLIVHDTHLNFASTAASLRPTRGGRRGTTIFAAEGGEGMPAGAIVHLFSRSVVELMRRDAVACQTALLRRASATSLDLDAPLVFDYPAATPGLACRVYPHPRVVRFSGLTFVTAADNRVRAISLTGIGAGLVFDRCGIETRTIGDVSSGADGVLLQESVGVAAHALTIRNCRYGYMLSRGARDCTIDGLVATANRHPVYPAYWAQRCTFRNIVGDRNVATLDSHSAIDIAYENVTARNDLGMSNIRSMGARLLNARIVGGGPFPFRVAHDVWTPGASGVWTGHDVTLRNVELGFSAGPPPNRIGMVIGPTDRLRLDAVTTNPPGLLVAIPHGNELGVLGVTGGNVRTVKG